MRFQPEGVDPRRDARGAVLAEVMSFLVAAGNVVLSAVEHRGGFWTWASLGASFILLGRIWTQFPGNWERWRQLRRRSSAD